MRTIILFLFVVGVCQAQTVSTPVITPSTGSFVGTTAVGATSSTSSATLCYTLNGSNPTATSPGTCDSNGGAKLSYLTPLLISSTTTLKVLGTLSAYTNSAVASAIITITPGTQDGPAVLPNGFTTSCGVFCTTFPNTTGYTVVTVCSSSCTYNNSATALSSVGCGTVIKVTAGQSFQVSASALQTCTSSAWIVTLSSDCTSAGICTHLPAQGNRVTPSLVSYMATLTGDNVNNTPTINIGNSGGTGAAYYWFGPGLEITGPADGVEYNEAGVVNDSPSSGGAPLINNIVIDRDYIHCQPGQECTRGAQVTGSYEAIVDSYVNDFHSLQSTQSQGWWEANGYGPFKIVNNYLGGASEVFMSGGSGTSPTGVVPSDFEIAGNYMIYSFGTVGYIASNAGNIRDIVEFKEGRRILFQGNYMDATPVAGMNANDLNAGMLIYLAQSGTDAPWLTTQDVTARYNYSLSSTAPIVVGGGNEGAVSPPATAAGYFDFSVHDNLFDNQNQANGMGFSNTGISLSADNYPPTTNLLVNHNTIISSESAGSHSFANVSCGDSGAGGLYQGSFALTNNMGFNGSYGVIVYFNDGSGAMLSSCMSGVYTWTANANILLDGQTYGGGLPSGNFFPANIAAVDFTNFNSGDGGNYLLTGASPYHNAATDGKDIGVSNYTCLNAMTAAAYNGTYTESVGACASGILYIGSSPSIKVQISAAGVQIK